MVTLLVEAVRQRGKLFATQVDLSNEQACSAWHLQIQMADQRIEFALKMLKMEEEWNFSVQNKA